MDNAVKELGYVDGKFNGNWFQWLWFELKQVFKSPAMCAIWFFGVGFQLANLLAHPITWVTLLTFIATIVGLGCTCALCYGNSVNGFLGFVSVFGFCFVNIATGHWWSVLDQLIFLCAIDLPLMFKWKTWGANFDKEVKMLTKKNWVVVTLSVLALWAILIPVGFLLKDTAPFVDALVLAIGAVASVLCVLKYTNSFSLWLLEDIINIILWISTAIHLGINGATIAMLVSTIMYLVTAIYGRFIGWKSKTK